MTTQIFAGHDVEVDPHGFLTQADAWTIDVGEAIAAEAQIELTPEHWEVINFAREDFAANAVSPGLRRISKLTGVPMKALYKLFPKGPGKLVARIAGIPKPKSCL